MRLKDVENFGITLCALIRLLHCYSSKHWRAFEYQLQKIKLVVVSLKAIDLYLFKPWQADGLASPIGQLIKAVFMATLRLVTARSGSEVSSSWHRAERTHVLCGLVGVQLIAACCGASPCWCWWSPTKGRDAAQRYGCTRPFGGCGFSRSRAGVCDRRSVRTFRQGSACWGNVRDACTQE
jgi:hypothetical protein